jgi:hypothetical protein
MLLLLPLLLPAAVGLGGDDDANSKTICTHQAATPTPSLPAREE